MPRISELQKIKEIAIAKLKSFHNLIDGRTSAAFQRKIYETNRKDTATKLLNQISDILSVKETIGGETTSSKKVTTKMIQEAQKIKSAPVKTLYKFVVNVLKTYVYPPTNEWMNIRFFEYGKRSGKWSNENIQDQKTAEEDKIEPITNKVIWKQGEKLVYVVQQSVTVETNLLVTDDNNKPFKMTTKGIKAGVYKNKKHDVIQYNGIKPYQYEKFFQVKGVIEDVYSTSVGGKYKAMFIDLPTFLGKIFNEIASHYNYFAVVENLGIIKVNNGLEGIGETSPINMMMQNKIILKDSWLRYAKDISDKSYEETENVCVSSTFSFFD